MTGPGASHPAAASSSSTEGEQPAPCSAAEGWVRHQTKAWEPPDPSPQRGNRAAAGKAEETGPKPRPQPAEPCEARRECPGTRRPLPLLRRPPGAGRGLGTHTRQRPSLTQPAGGPTSWGDEPSPVDKHHHHPALRPVRSGGRSAASPRRPRGRRPHLLVGLVEEDAVDGVGLLEVHGPRA